jgi:alpha-methylacyl-CoA racemase
MENPHTPPARAGIDTKVLSSLRVVEISGIGPGPFCAMHLADLGADVISIGRPDSPGNRKPVRALLGRGKRSVVADLKTPAGRDLVLQLVSQADVLIEGMRPGVMEKLGLGPEPCAERNPRLVYGRMTGWGQSGPLAQVAGHDNNYISVSGALWHASPAGQRPVTPFTTVGDIGGGALYLAVGLLSAVLHSRATGQGCVVDAAILDGSAHALNLLLHARHAGMVNDTRGRSIHDSSPFYETYVCADGQHITIGAIEPQFYALLLQNLGLHDDPDFQAMQWDHAAWPKMRARLAAVFLGRTRAQWQEQMEGTDICFGAVLSPAEAARHPHNIARRVYLEQEGVLQTAPAPRFDGRAYAPGAMAYGGEHTAALLASLSATPSEWPGRDGSPGG